MARSKRKEGQRGEEGDWRREGWSGGEDIGTIPSSPHPMPVSAEGNSSKQGLCFQTQIQQNTAYCHETSKWAILTSEGLQMLEELSVSGQWD